MIRNTIDLFNHLIYRLWGPINISIIKQNSIQRYPMPYIRIRTIGDIHYTVESPNDQLIVQI